MRTREMFIGQYVGAIWDSVRSVYQPENARLVAAFAAPLGYFAGVLTDAQLWLIGILLVAAAGDLTSGSVAAIRTRTFSRTRLLDGGLGRILRLHLLLVGLLFDRLVMLIVPENSRFADFWALALPAATVALVWLIAVELASILRNIERGGQRVPGALSGAVRRLREKMEGPNQPTMQRRSTDRPELPL